MSRWHFLVLLLCTFFAGCGGSFAAKQAMIKQLTSATKEMADLLTTVKDKPTAQAAAPKLLTLVERVEELGERLDELDGEAEDFGPDPEVAEEVAPWIAEHSRLIQEQLRISKIPEAREGLGEGWKRLTGGAYDPGGVFAPRGRNGFGTGSTP
jgi:hypothetical protein